MNSRNKDEEEKKETQMKKEFLDAQNRIHYRFLLWDDMIEKRISEDEFYEQIIILNKKINYD
jgi:hypothetical protein